MKKVIGNKKTTTEKIYLFSTFVLLIISFIAKDNNLQTFMAILVFSYFIGNSYRDYKNTRSNINLFFLLFYIGIVGFYYYLFVSGQALS